MDSGEVVIHEMQGNSMPKAFDFFGKSIGKPSEHCALSPVYKQAPKNLLYRNTHSKETKKIAF